MICKKYFGLVFFLILMFTVFSYAQNVLQIKQFDGSPGSFFMTQIKADTAANHGILPDRVYELQRDGIYLNTEIFNIAAGKTIRLRSADGPGRKPVIFQFPQGTGANPQRPPGNLFVLLGGNLEMKNLIVAGYFEPIDTNLNNVQGGLVNTTQAGSTIIVDGCILTNINGQHLRTGSATKKVQVTNSIFANMGALSSSNLGAGKGIDLREASCDTLIIQNTTFVNYQDRPIRHYNFANPLAGTGGIKYGLIDHNSFINGFAFHGLLSLGNVGDEMHITNNLFVDGFAGGEDPNDATRSAEWQNTGEKYANGNNRMTWIFTAPNDTTAWEVKNNFYAISDAGQAYLTQYGLSEGSPLSWHINGRIGADSLTAFTKVQLQLQNIPALMDNMMRWYRDPNGGNMTKNTPSSKWQYPRDDMDRRGYAYYSDTFNASYPTTSPAYSGAAGYPAGDLNWFPDQKALWEAGTQPFAINVDGLKDAFYDALTGPGDGYLQLKYYACNNNGAPYNNPDLSAKIWTAWDDTWLYFYEEVKDNVVSMNGTASWQNDGLEFKIDPQATVSGQSGASVFAPNITALGGANSDSLSGVPDGSKQWARRLTSDGYVIELAIKWSAITTNSETITPAVDNVFGMAINQHDNDVTPASRRASIMWAAVMMDQVWNTPEYMGTVKFLADNKLQFIPTNNITGDTNPVPFDGTPFYVNVDANKDPVYTALKGPDDGYLQVRSYAYNNNGTPADDNDLSAKMWTAWDDTWFYFYEEIKDNVVSMNGTASWQNDGLEFKIDPQPTDSTQGGESVFAPNITALGGANSDSLSGVPDGSKQWARKLITGGYAIELAIKWSAITTNSETITPAVDNVFGMAINQHDNDVTPASRRASVMWAAVMLDQAWNTPKYMGTVKYLPDNKLQFIPSNNMTGVTNLIPYDGSEWTGVAEYKYIPKEFSMKQNYPNPFNPSTKIEFSVIESAPVSLKIYNSLGQLAATLIDNETKDIGFYSVNYNASKLSSGMYIYVLRQGQNVISKKMVLLK